MKLTAILMLVGLLHAGATGYGQKVTLSASNMPLEKVCSEIEHQTGYYFFYSDQLSKEQHLITLQVKDADIAETLRQLFSGLPFTYQIIDKVVVVKPVAVAVDGPRADTAITPVRFVDVKGTVMNKQLEPLSGASVISVKTKRATQTNEKGEFTLKGLTIDDAMRISFIGYQANVVKIGNKTQFTIFLDPATDELDKVVLQAYSTTSQRFSTAQISVVSGEELREQPVMDPLLALENRVPGLVITPTAGYQSGPLKVEIRGQNSINPGFASDPLYVIDGVPQTILSVGGVYTNPFLSANAISRGIDQNGLSPAGGQSPLFGLNTEDIESIEVLKDASALAAYGSRGANGVILITTRKGHPGRTGIDINFRQGVNLISSYIPYLNTQQYLAMRREAFKNDGITPSLAPGASFAPDLFYDTTRYTNWQKLIYGHPASETSAGVGVSGGTVTSNYRLSANYNSSRNIGQVSGGDQSANVSANINLSSQNQRLKLGFSYNYSFSDVDDIGYRSGATTLPPNAPSIFDSTGRPNYTGWDKTYGSGSYPFGYLFVPYSGKTNGTHGSVNLSYTILKGLNARVLIGYNQQTNNGYKASTILSQDPNSSVARTGTATFATTTNENLDVDPNLNYNVYIGHGQLSVQTGATFTETVTKTSEITGSGYTDDNFLHTLDLAPTITASDHAGAEKFVGAFAQLSYVYDQKYILNVTGRRDGSSRFGPGRQFGNFGSVGLGWIVTAEDWARKVLPEFISFLKLVGSYGLVGQDNVGQYSYLSQWSNNDGGIPPYDSAVSLVPVIQPNPDYHWETDKQLNLSLDLGLLHDRITLHVGVYRNRVNDQLVNFPTPVFTGFTSVVANSPADLQNEGVEFSISAKLVHTKNIDVSFGTGLSRNANRLISYPDLAQSPYYSTYKIGKPINGSWTLNYTGINPMNGFYTFTDYNHDGVIAPNYNVAPGSGLDDRGAFVQLVPFLTGGFNFSIRYKSLNISPAFGYSLGVLQNPLTQTSSSGGMTNMPAYVYDRRWQYPGQKGAEYPGLHANGSAAPPNLIGGDGLLGQSNGGYAHNDYIRLQGLGVSYSLPLRIAKKAGFQGMSITANASNLFYLSHFPRGVDPQSTIYGPPQFRTITSGVRLSF